MAQPRGVLFLLLVSAVTLASGRVLRDTFAGAQKFTCGLRPVKPYPTGERIAVGREAKYGSYPWQAGISGHIANRFVLCGGTIIDDNWVLSAAHCFEGSHGEAPADMTVFVGDHDRINRDPSEQRFKIERLFIHERFNSTTHDSDIALLKLRPNKGEVIHFDDNVQPACLPAPDTPYTEGKACLISGWGDNGRADYDMLLHTAEVPLWSLSQCKDTLRKYGPRNETWDKLLTSNMVCAGPQDYFGGICHGDLGGPLVSKEEVGYTVLGIASWGIPERCGDFGKPGMFVKVKQFLPWIQETMQA